MHSAFKIGCCQTKNASGCIRYLTTNFESWKPSTQYNDTASNSLFKDEPVLKAFGPTGKVSKCSMPNFTVFRQQATQNIAGMSQIPTRKPGMQKLFEEAAQHHVQTFRKLMSTQNISSTSQIPSGVPGVLFEKASQQHLQTVNILLKESFFKDEPITKALGLAGKLDPSFISAEANLVLKGFSIVAIEESSKQIIAAAINKILFRDDVQAEPALIEKIKCPNTRKIVRFWHQLTLKPNIFDIFHVNQYLEVGYLVTTPAARGKRLAEKLTRASLQLATERGQNLAVMVCTNVASVRIAQKIDMLLIGVNCICGYFTGADLLKLTHLTHPNDKVFVFAKALRPNREGAKSKRS